MAVSFSPTFCSLFHTDGGLPLAPSLATFVQMRAKSSRKRLRPVSIEEEERALRLSIIGRPNVGKSTLFNRLVGRRAAIVHETEGVTRDRQECIGQLSGITLAAIDTPGLLETEERELRRSALARETDRHHRNDVVSDGEEVLAAAVEQAESAIGDADAVLFMVDGKEGFTEKDEKLAKWLLRQKKKDGSAVEIVCVVNKCESSSQVADEAFIGLGLPEPIRISAQHGDGMADLISGLSPLADAKEEWWKVKQEQKQLDDTSSEGGGKVGGKGKRRDDDRIIPKIVVAGRPNVGKSTLVNALCGRARVRAGPEAGITRDPVSVHLDVKVPSALAEQTKKKKSMWKKKGSAGGATTATPREGGAGGGGEIGTADGMTLGGGDADNTATTTSTTTSPAGNDDFSYYDVKLEVVDTAGLAKRTQDGGELQTLTHSFSIQAINDAEVVIMMLDATQPFIPTKQDLAILRLAEENGKAIVIVANKVDILEKAGADMKDIEKAVRDRLSYTFPHMEGAQLLFVSAKEENQKDMNGIINAALRARQAWAKRVPTAQLNKWLDAVMMLKPPPPSPSGQRIRIKYVTQSASKPPTFILFGGSKRRAPKFSGGPGQAELPESYLRFLRRSIRQEFSLQGTPIRMQVRRYASLSTPVTSLPVHRLHAANSAALRCASALARRLA